MKKKKADIILQLPDNFCKTCKVFSIRPQEAVAFFINKVYLFAYFSRFMDMPYPLVTSIFDHYLRSYDTLKRPLNRVKRKVAIQCIKELFAIIPAKMPRKKKVRAYNRLINNWHDAIKGIIPSQDITASNGFSIVVSKDFCLMCDLFRCTPVEILQYYVDNVSFPANTGSRPKEITKYATSFFLQHPSILEQTQAN